MSTPTTHKIAYGCLGAIGVVFLLVFAIVAFFPDSPEETDTPQAEPEPSLAEAARDDYYSSWTKEVDGELVFDHPGGFDEEIPTVEWIDSENENEVIVRVIELDGPDFYHAICAGIVNAGYPGYLDGEDGRMKLSYVVVQDLDGNELESCDNLFMFD